MSDTGITPLTPEQVAEQEANAAHEGYIHRVAEEVDVAANVAAGGVQDETFSSRMARDAEQHKVFGEAVSHVLAVFQEDHGAKAQAADVERAKQVIALETPELTAGVKATNVDAKPRKPGFWSTLGRKIGEAIGQAKFGQ